MLTSRALAEMTTCGHSWPTPVHAEGERLCWPCADAWLDRMCAAREPEDGWPIQVYWPAGRFAASVAVVKRRP